MQLALTLLISAMQLLTLISNTPNVPQSFKDSAIVIANQAITTAQQVIADENAKASTTPPVILPIIDPVPPTFGSVIYATPYTTPYATPYQTPIVANAPTCTLVATTTASGQVLHTSVIWTSSNATKGTIYSFYQGSYSPVETVPDNSLNSGRSYNLLGTDFKVVFEGLGGKVTCNTQAIPFVFPDYSPLLKSDTSSPVGPLSLAYLSSLHNTVFVVLNPQYNIERTFWNSLKYHIVSNDFTPSDIELFCAGGHVVDVAYCSDSLLLSFKITNSHPGKLNIIIDSASFTGATSGNTYTASGTPLDSGVIEIK